MDANDGISMPPKCRFLFVTRYKSLKLECGDGSSISRFGQTILH